MIRKALLIASASLIAACTSRPTEGSPGNPQAKGDAVSPALVGTRWVLVTVGATPVTAGATAREPYIVLGTDAEPRLTGSSGCNQMFGGYALAGDAITFNGVGATKMACERGMNIESSFFSALGKVARWRIAGQQLELRDAAGAVVATFEARPGK